MSTHPSLADRARTVPVARLIMLLGMAALACSSSPTLQEVRVFVSGDSIMGTLYTKTLELRPSGTGYRLQYRCQADPRFLDRCPCNTWEGTVEAAVVQHFLSQVERLQDEGERARCCDHPWTVITWTYADWTVRRKTVSMEPIDFEGAFGLTCGKTSGEDGGTGWCGAS